MKTEMDLPFYQGRADSAFVSQRGAFYARANANAKAGDTLVSVRAPVGDINYGRRGMPRWPWRRRRSPQHRGEFVFTNSEMEN